jgi:hypothetical protein
VSCVCITLPYIPNYMDESFYKRPNVAQGQNIANALN